MNRFIARLPLVLALLVSPCRAAQAADRIEIPAIAGNSIPQALRGEDLRPLSLASADFDGDGVADLAAGFGTGGGGGIVVLYRGNADALYPHSPEARQRRAQGRSVAEPFLQTDRLVALSAPPDFLLAGDFDADGRMDLASASAGGSSVAIHAGDGAGGFREAGRIGLPGALTALGAGDVGLRDGLADLVAAVAGPAGARAVVLQSSEGAMRAAPVALALAEAASTVTIGGGERGNAIALRGDSGRLVRIERAARAWNLVESPEADARSTFTPAAAEEDEAASLALRVDSRARGRVVLRRDGTLASVTKAASATFVVDVTTDLGDAAPGNGTCADVNGDCSLRAAIQEANALPGADTITFAISGSGVPSIPVGSLPTITETVTIDGTTQAAGRVAVTGTSNGFLLTLGADDCVVRGLVLNGNGNAGARFQSSGNVFEGNFVGTTDDGTATQGTFFVMGVNLQTGSNNRIGGPTLSARNVFAGGTSAIRIDAGTGHVVEGNYLGTDVTGTVDLGGTSQGIRLFTAGVATIGGSAPGAGNVVSGWAQAGIEIDVPGSLVQGNRIGTNAAGTAPIPNGTGILCNFNGDVTIGGSAPGAGNLVSGNSLDGIELEQNAPADIVIQGNRIGTDAAGTFAIANQGYGLRLVGASQAQIGGASAGARNVISGNLLDGIFITKFVTVAATANVIQGNFIGTDVTGTTAIANLRSGIAFEWAENTLVGGTAPGEGNVVSGNFLHGIDLNLTGNVVKNLIYGNRIGTNAFGTGPLGNGLDGLHIPLNTHGALIGGTGAGQANTIAYNGGAGVGSSGNRALHVAPNSIYDNGGLGLDLFDDGVTANRPGATNNFPVVTLANDIGGATSVAGYLDAKAATSFDIHIFSSLSCDASGHGEGREYRKTVPLTTDAAGHGVFTTTITPAIPGGRYVTAYAVAPGTLDDTSEFSFCRQLTGGPPPEDVPLALFAISPAVGGAGPVTVQITGEGMLPGATVRLERTGSPDILASGVVVSAGGTTVTATFDLTGAAQGVWDVTVDIPGDTATLAQAFTVAAATEPDVWADVLGRGTLVVRAGREQTFFVIYGNRGNVDSQPVELRLTIPRQLKVTFVEEEDGSLPVLSIDKPTVTGGSGESGIHYYVRSIPAVSSRVFAFRVLTVEADPGEFGQEVEMSLWLMSDPDLGPIVDAPHDSSVALSPTVVADEPGHFAMDIDVSGNSGSGTIHFDLTTAAVDFEADPTVSKTVSGSDVTYVVHAAFSNSPPTEYTATVAGPQAAIDAALLYDKLTTSTREGLDKEAKGQMLVLSGLIDEDGSVTLQNFEEGAKVTNIVNWATWVAPRETPAAEINALNGVMQGAWQKKILASVQNDPGAWYDFLGLQNAADLTSDVVMAKLEEKFADPKIRSRILRPLRVFLAIDPNEKAGPGGASDGHYVTGAAPLPYTITFENIETASAAAQEVVVTDQLDGSKLDLSTFALGPISFGTHVVDVPPGSTSFTGDVDLRPGIDLIARVTAGFNAATGLATWHFFSLDPATGQPTSDPILGFLPPNVATPEGEGHVSFTVAAKTGLASGTEIHNQASIVFDANPAIVTADWLNTIDVTPPTSQVAALPGSSCSGIDVAWSGTDAHSGILDYDIFVSVDGGAFAPWLTQTTATSSIFYGTLGSTYAFFSVARDAAGNEEAPAGGADATTTVGSPTPLTDLLAPTSGSAGGALVGLTGSGYASGASVVVGGVPASGVVVNDPTSLTANFPPLSAGALYDVVMQNPGGCASTFEKAWFADFTDVPSADIFHASVEKIARRGVTVGCGNGLYCINRAVTRAEMAVFLIKGKYNLSLVPPPATGTLFGDVHAGDFAADWIEQLAKEGITVGCGNGNYCPNANITRAEMAVFLLKSEHGPLYVPPPATGTVFGDVHAGDFAAAWIEQIALEGITAGCGDGNFCPGDPVSRGQMAAFLSLTFGF